tara:strand:- start:2935 stop:3138 length:204 start_codon:yes stop_codon:yes gene_type:complete
MLSAETLIRHTAVLKYIDKAGRPQSTPYTAWSAKRATTMAWTRAKSLRRSGEALAFRILHDERVIPG